jgi:hypothetical protein
VFEKSELLAMKHKLSEALLQFDDSNVLVGFDGYIDKLVRLPKGRGYFSSISEFILHISGYQNQSADMKVEHISEKLGGNGPLLAQSLAAKGVSVTCVGAMGEPNLCQQFADLAKNCEVISVEQPADCFAIEFSDSKLMFGDTGSLERINFQSLCGKVGRERLITMFNKCDLFCFTNWSGITHANELLHGILTEICPQLSVKSRNIFFDLADPTTLDDVIFSQFFELLSALQQYFTVIVGLNPKEFLQVYNHFFKLTMAELTSDMPSELLAAFPAHELVLHGLDYAMAGDRTHEMQRVPGELVKSPRVVTGGGDNFNAGYCIGKLLLLTPAECALLGNLSSMLYVQNGTPANLSQIVDFICNIEKRVIK